MPCYYFGYNYWCMVGRTLMPTFSHSPHFTVLRDECDRNICQNGGTCRRLAEDYLCLCPQYYIGLTCTERKDDYTSTCCCVVYLIFQFSSAPSVLPLEMQCSSTLVGQLLTVRCSANKPLAMTNCSLDGNPLLPCMYTAIITALVHVYCGTQYENMVF